VGTPNDPGFGNQWGLHKVEAATAWDTTTGSAGVSIAILDTGVDQNHPDLKDKIVKNVNFTGSSTVNDVHGHGTHVAGIAAASTNNGIGVAGLGYDSTIMNVKVLGR
jgi:thermitase